MANCKYCGQPAGILRSLHKECQSISNSGRSQILSEIESSIRTEKDFSKLKNRIENIATESYIGTEEKNLLLVSGWERAVDSFLEDGVLDKAEETALVQYKGYFSLNDQDLDKNGYRIKAAKAGVLRDLLEGKAPKRVVLEGAGMLNLQKNEQIIWAFPGAEYFEEKVRRQYVGRSNGVSIRVMKGVYYRVGEFKGRAIERTEHVSQGPGALVLTTKHLYFHGPMKSLRIPYKKIVAFQPYSDGIGITKDGANARLQIFRNGDGWFTYNVLANINNLDPS